MWAVYVVIAWFLLALLLPVGWSLGRTWHRIRVPRPVTCPGLQAPALIAMDPRYAVRMHALGNDELRVKQCSRWPERRQCGQECLGQIAATG
jgi:hypothetical protein